MEVNTDYDLFIISADTGFFEDISLISYYSATGMIFPDKEAGNNFITQYSKIENKVDRIKRLKQLHFDLLMSGRIIPLAISSYHAISRNGWKIDLSKYYANCPLWKITKEI